MTLLELLTGKVPYDHIKNDGALTGAISNEKLPNKPSFNSGDPNAKLKDDIWSTCLNCWIIVTSKKCLGGLSTRQLDKLSTEENKIYTDKLFLQERRPSMEDVLRDLISTKYRHGVQI